MNFNFGLGRSLSSITIYEFTNLVGPYSVWPNFLQGIPVIFVNNTYITCWSLCSAGILYDMIFSFSKCMLTSPSELCSDIVLLMEELMKYIDAKMPTDLNDWLKNWKWVLYLANKSFNCLLRSYIAYSV